MPFALARGYASSMLARFERHRTIRLLLALALAVLATVRGGGIALVCDGPVGSSAGHRFSSDRNASVASMPAMPGMAESESAHPKGGCDTPDQARECALMAACAPALSAALADPDVVAMPESLATVGPVRTLVSVDRSPDPPPPRS